MRLYLLRSCSHYIPARVHDVCATCHMYYIYVRISEGNLGKSRYLGVLGIPRDLSGFYTGRDLPRLSAGGSAVRGLPLVATELHGGPTISEVPRSVWCSGMEVPWWQHHSQADRLHQREDIYTAHSRVVNFLFGPKI